MGKKPKTILVIGGGIADIQAAIDLGDMGIKAHQGGSSER